MRAFIIMSVLAVLTLTELWANDEVSQGGLAGLFEAFSMLQVLLASYITQESPEFLPASFAIPKHNNGESHQ